MVLSLVFVRLHYFGWSPVYDCKTYLETNIVQNCSYFGFGGYFLVAAEIKARQLEVEEERRTKEFAKQLEIKHKIEQAGNVAQRIELEAKERRKTQEAKDEAARLAAE